MTILSTSNISTWRVAKKTRPIRAKSMVNLMVDKTVASKFLVNTLEAREPLGDGAMFCIGEAGDAWQQMPKTLLRKYDIVDIDVDGWMHCKPKEDASVEFIELTEAEGYIVGKWGETIDGVENLQAFVAGDFLLRDRADHTDMWIVRRKLFLNTYNEI